MQIELVDFTKDLLQRAGWTPDRCSSISDAEAKLASLGVGLTAPARAFLERFGNLKVADRSPSHTCFATDPVEAARYLEPGDKAAAEAKAGAALSPIGDVREGVMVLLMDEHQRAFGLESISGELFILARSGTELLNMLCLGMPFRAVTKDDHWDLAKKGQPAKTPPPDGETWEQGLHRRVTEKLGELGWDVDGKRQQADIVVAGNTTAMPSRVKAFLEQYDGLRLRAFSPWQASTTAVHISPHSAAYRLTAAEVRAYEDRVGARLCPIGEFAHGQSILLMDEHGRSFAVDYPDSQFSLIAENELELLAFLLLGDGSSVAPVTADIHWETWSKGNT